MAAGFGSIRRFNATFQNLYGRSPGELRRATARDRNGHEAGHYTFRIGYRPPYDWESLIEFLAARAIPGVETVTPEEYRRNISLDGMHGVDRGSAGAREAIRWSWIFAIPIRRRCSGLSSACGGSSTSGRIRPRSPGT